MDTADAQYKAQQKKTIQTHAEYYESHLPKVLKVTLHTIGSFISVRLTLSIGFKSSG